MIKPLLLTLEYPPQIGGIAQYLKGEVENFAGEVAVRPSHADKKLSWLPLLWRTRRDYRKNNCDGLWVSHVLPIGYVALAWKILFKTPCRAYVHGLDLARPQKSSWKKFWVKRILSSADEIVANSNATAGLLANYGLNPARARVQYPRIEKINAAVYLDAGRRLRQQYNIGNKPLLLTISRLVKRKGIDLVIKALPQVWKKIPDLVYVVVGEGDYYDSLMVETRHCCVSTGRQSQIFFTGAVSEEEKYGWFSACDCFILTPIDAPDDFEGYGIVYKEAQAFGKPNIGSRVGGVPEAVGEEGILVEPGNIKEITKAILTICHSRESGNPDRWS